MTDNDIIKALEEELKTALTINHRFEESNDTENPDDHKFIALLINTIKLINRQKADNERLKKLLEEEEAKFKECAKRFYKVGVKDFVERLRYVSKWSQSNAFSDRFVTVRDIDDLEEEMVGAENV